MDIAAPAITVAAAGTVTGFGATRAPLIVLLPSDEEMAAHRAYLDALDRESRGRCLWLSLAREEAA